MSQKNKDRISIANVLALVGLAAIGVATFFGSLMQSSDGKPSGAIIWSIVVVGVLGFLLFMSIHAKTSSDSKEKWRWVEWISLILFCVSAIFFSFSFQRFFYVLSQKDVMQEQARSEVRAIKGMLNDYTNQKKGAIEEAREQFENYSQSDQYRSKVKDALYNYYTQIVQDNVNNWAEKAAKITDLTAYEKDLSDIEKRIDGWRLMELSSLAFDLENKETAVWESIENKIADFEENNKLIPVVSGGVGQYRLEVNAFQFDLDKKPDAQFAKMLRESNGHTILGWVIYVILILLILLNYGVASRSDYIDPNGLTKGDVL